MDFLNTEDHQRETIRLALAGDHEAGIDALRMCRAGLYAGKLSASMAHYLASRLDDVLEGIKPDRILTSDDFRQALLYALRINKPPGKPANPLPEWQLPLGALAALMVRRGYKPKQINVAMSDARQKLQAKDLDDRECRRIRKTHEQMHSLSVDELTRIAGPYGEILKEYLPCK